MTAILAVGAASATAFVSFKNEAKRAAEILNTAFRLNVYTDDLQAFEYAAKTVGLESENVRDIPKDVNDRMGDIAINGGGEMVDIFKALGASPTPMPYGEIYSGLQNKVIDGLEMDLSAIMMEDGRGCADERTRRPKRLTDTGEPPVRSISLTRCRAHQAKK